MKAIIIIALILMPSILIHAEDWTTTDGKTYRSVKVLSHNDGFVMILDEDGGARVPLNTLPAKLQAKFGYNPIKASTCLAATQAADKAAAHEIEKEQEQAEVSRQMQATVSNVRSYQATSIHVATASSPTEDAITQAMKQDIQGKIRSLQGDIQEMIKQREKDASTAGSHTHGGFDDKIASDQQEIAVLQSQLGNAPISHTDHPGRNSVDSLANGGL